MCWLAVAAVATLFFTWALWKSSNREQDAAKAEADTRALGLEQAASDSKTAQQRVEIDLAKAKEAQAVAEASLLELQRLIRDPRSIDWEKGKKILGDAPKGTVKLLYVAVNPDAHNLAHELYRFLIEMGWSVSIPEEGKGEMPAIGITIEMSAEGWVPADSSIPLGPMPGDAKALETFLLEAVKGNPSVGIRAKNRDGRDEFVSSTVPAPPGATPLPSIPAISQAAKPLVVVIGPKY